MMNIKRVLLKRTGETERAYILRSFNYASDRVSHCYNMQVTRQSEHNRGAAIFYQLEAATWHKRMVEYRECLENDFFPGTDVPIDTIFPADEWDRKVFTPAIKLALSSAYGNMKPDPGLFVRAKRIADTSLRVVNIDGSIDYVNSRPRD